MLVVKFDGFARSLTEHSALFDHGLIWQGRGIDRAGRNEMDGTSQQAPAKSTLFRDAGTPLMMGRPGNMIQRKSLPSAPAAAGGFYTTEPHAALRSPASSVVDSGRFSASAPQSRESTWPALTATAVQLVPLPASSIPIENPHAGILPQADGPSSSASIGRVENREQSATLFDFDRNAIRKVADDVAPSDQSRFVSPVMARIPASAMSANQQNFIRAACGSVATTFAISSETSSWRLDGASKSLGEFPWPTATPVQACAPEPLHAEIFSRDIRINPLGRVGGLAATLNSNAADAFPAQSLDLSLQHPKTPAAPDFALPSKESSPRRSLTEGEEVTTRSMNSEMRTAVGPQVLTVPEVADKVYRLLERRLVVERERRGVFRT